MTIAEAVSPTAEHAAYGGRAEPRVLLVDDDPVIRNCVGRFFRRLGFDVRVAGSARDAMKLLRESPVDAVITDLRLAGEDGGTIVDAILEEGPYWGPRIIVVSGDLSSASARRAVERGCITALKPFDIPALARRIRAMVGEGEGTPIELAKAS
ncbi:MAG: response regulator [Gemmatimonadales bacterium]